MQNETCSITKNNTPPWMFLTFLKIVKVVPNRGKQGNCFIVTFLIPEYWRTVWNIIILISLTMWKYSTGSYPRLSGEFEHQWSYSSLRVNATIKFNRLFEDHHFIKWHCIPPTSGKVGRSRRLFFGFLVKKFQLP